MNFLIITRIENKNKKDFFYSSAFTMIYKRERVLTSACGNIAMPQDWRCVASPSSPLNSSSWLMNMSTTSDIYRWKPKSHCPMLAAETPAKKEPYEKVQPTQRCPSD
jgi:hypothetical protein